MRLARCRFTPERWGNRPAFLWIAEDLAVLRLSPAERLEDLWVHGLVERSASSAAVAAEIFREIGLEDVNPANSLWM
jgi:hypothetical protein